MGKKRIRSKIREEGYTSIRCPKCNSADITHYMGAQFGKYECKKCGYIGVIVIEKDEIKQRKIRKYRR